MVLVTLQLKGQQQHSCESQVPGIWDEDESPWVCQQLKRKHQKNDAKLNKQLWT